MNDTLGSEGIVPSVLVLGGYPQAYTWTETRPSRPSAASRQKIIHTAKMEMSQHMAKARVAHALKDTVPYIVDDPLTTCDQVLLWREKIVNNWIGEWIGSLSVHTYDDKKKIAHIIEKNGKVKPYRKYFQTEDTSSSFMVALNDQLNYYPCALRGQSESDGMFRLGQVQAGLDHNGSPLLE